jgi:ribosomal protein S18 acetylase RimI-like enzyme
MMSMRSTLPLVIVLCSAVISKAFNGASLLLLDGGANVDVLLQVRPAKIPQDMDRIRECRQTFSTDSSKNKLTAETNFYTGEALGKNLVRCVVAQERLFPWRIMGTADVRVNSRKSSAYVNNVYVRREAQGLGIGKLLMQGVETMLQKEFTDVEELSLNVDTSNAPAFSLYRKCGYDTPGIHSVVSRFGEVSGLNARVRMEKGIATKIS